MEIKGRVLLYDGVHSERKRMAELLGLKRNYFVRGKVEYPLYQSLCVPYTKPLPLVSWLYLPYDALCECAMEYNPLEDHLEVIEPMTLGEFCDAIGYERDNAQRLLDNYRKITFNWKGKQQYFCTFFYSGYAYCVQP